MTPYKRLKSAGNLFFIFGWVLLLLLFLPLTSQTARAQGGETGIKSLYESGDCKGIIATSSTWVSPTAPQSLYLGLCQLRLKDKQGAIKAWKNYLKLEDESDQKREISKYLTLLIREEAKENAKNLVRQEQAISITIDPKAIAVYPFQNLGLPENDAYAKGMVDFIITDLSQVKEITVVERVHIQAILDELRLAKAPLFDKKSGPRLGKLVGAGKVTTGSYADLEENKIRLDASVVQTEQGNTLTSPTASGPASTFFQLEKEIVFKILCGLGHCPASLDSETRKAVEKIHTKNLKAFLLYSKGLDFFDQGKFSKASQNFFLAVEEDPTFSLARKGLLEMPIMPLNLEGIVSSAESSDGFEDSPSPAVVSFSVPTLPQFMRQNIITEPVSVGNSPAIIDFVILIPGNGG